MRILAIEDEPKVAEALREGLEAERFEVTLAASGEDGFFLATTESFDLLLLDLMLPGRGGLEILRALRKRDSVLPALILTAKDSVEDRVAGLDSGADDYLVKPFAFPELLARIRAAMRRGRPDRTLRLTLADLEMDCVTRRVTRAGREVALTVKEYELLEYLLRNQGQVVSRDMLARSVWRTQVRAAPLNNVIDVHIAHLRRKIDEGFEPALLNTIRGVGFLLGDKRACD